MKRKPLYKIKLQNDRIFRFYRVLNDGSVIPDSELPKVKAPNYRVAVASRLTPMHIKHGYPSNLYVRVDGAKDLKKVSTIVIRYNLDKLVLEYARAGRDIVKEERQKLLEKQREYSRRSYQKNWTMHKDIKRANYSKKRYQYIKMRNTLLELGFDPALCPEWKDRHTVKNPIL